MAIVRRILGVNSQPIAQLQAFLAVGRLRSFSAAARELSVSRSAVSQAVQQLEQQLRVVLLVRTTRSVSLTEAGRRLVETAGPALRQTLAALTDVSAQPGEVVGKVRLSVPRSAVPLVVAPVLPAFRQRHPRIEVEVGHHDVGDAVREIRDTVVHELGHLLGLDDEEMPY